MKIPGFKTCKEFSEYSGVNLKTVQAHMKQGYCSWPRKIRDQRTGHPLYVTWRGMLQRCYNKSAINYRNYGGRGVTVCAQWRASFWQFVKDMQDKPEGCTLDRIDNNKGYNKENCRWVTYRKQTTNRSTNIGYVNITPNGNGFLGRLHICGKRLSTPTQADIEQVELDLMQLSLLYREYV